MIVGRKAQLCATVALCLICGAGRAWAAEAAVADANVDEVVVTGTREAGRTAFKTLVPVDVLDADAIQASATAQLGENLAQQLPSFIVQKLPTSDGLQFVRPATLRNLSPDQTLVLLNGKRFHRSAFLGARGAQGPDLAQIPSFAVGRMEVLRDGASAQYGSDAIAGVINILLDDKTGFAGFGQVGQFYEGDGTTWRLGAKGGVAVGDGGHVTATVEYSDAELTSRTRQRPDAIAFAQANPGVSVPDPVQRWGNPDLETLQGAINGEVPLSDRVDLYGFATATKTDGINDINWRNPSANPAIFNTAPVFPGFNLKTIYPAGFTPREGIHGRDVQAVGGVRGEVGEAFTWDVSASYGRNASRFFLKNSINASLGPQSPFDFDLGRLVQEEVNLNADAVYRWTVPGLAEPVNVAFGAEHRTETYEIEPGDPASYAVGPGANFGLAPNSNGFPGFSPLQAGEWDQKSYAAYVDLEAELTDRWSLGGALRYEDYSEFGSKWTGKVATRFEITPDIAVRGSFSTGFRAPTPGQLNSTSTSQGLDTVTLQLFQTGRLSPTNPVAAFLGAKPLEPEESETFTGGLIWRVGASWSGSIDAYRIDVDQRFSTSPTVTVTPAIRAQLVALGLPGAAAYTSISWFTNDFDTRTKGVDVVVTYDADVGPGRVTVTGAYNYNKTEVTDGALGASATQQRLFEESRPNHNFAGSVQYRWSAFEVLGRVRYYGSWTDSTGNATGEIFQDFGGVTFFDLSGTWHATENASVRIGAENIFDKYPDEAVFQASRGLVYSRNSPYDTNGGQYYARVDVRF